MSTLETRQLTVVFRRRGSAPLRAVDNVSFTLRPGETVALVGESGSGKSTVVRSLAGLQKITSGTVLLDGEPLRHRARALRAYRSQVQTIFQDPFASLNPAHTVAHHLVRPLRIHGAVRGSENLQDRVLDLLQSVNLTPPAEVSRKRPHELSGGQRQRVAIARALAPEPTVLLADEPVSMLDVSVRLEILNLLAQLGPERDLAMLYVTHDLATARYFSKEILVMYRGRVIERGTSDDVILHPAHPYTQLLAAAIPDPTKTKDELASDRAVRQTARAARSRHHMAVAEVGCPFAPRCPFAMDKCVTDTPPELTIATSHATRCWLYDSTEPEHLAAPAGPGEVTGHPGRSGRA
jgi:peptide/nickel transport system ATP-binding protein